MATGRGAARVVGGARPRRTIALFALLAALAVALPLLPTASADASVSPGRQRLLDPSTAQPAPLPAGLPVPLGAHAAPPAAQPLAGGGVDPNLTFPKEPAPMGVTDFGVTPSGDPYQYATTSFLGAVEIGTLRSSGSGSSAAGFQLNTELVLGSAPNLFVYWVQNVVSIDTSTRTFSIVNNIWNWSSSSQRIASGAIVGNGSIYSVGSQNLYEYSPAAGSLPGIGVVLPTPASVEDRLETIVVGGVPRVLFAFQDGYGWVTYDNVSFPWASSLADDGYLVDGFSYAPIGLYLDAEWVYTGGGSGFTNLASDLNLSLDLFNGENYQAVPSAYDHGGNTAESESNVRESYLAAPVSLGGIPMAHEVNGSGSLGPLYGPAQVGFLNLTAPTPNGTISIGGLSLPFVGGGANLTLAAGDYPVTVARGGTLLGAWNLTVVAGTLLRWAPSELTFVESGLPNNFLWSVSVDGGLFRSNGSTLGLALYEGSYGYAVTPIAGYRLTGAYRGTIAIPASAGTIYLTWTRDLYPLDISVEGLPSTVAWTLTLEKAGGGVATLHAAGPSGAIPLSNGSYAYLLDLPYLYDPQPSEGNLSIDGALGELIVLAPIRYGSLEGSVEPANATLLVNGSTVPLSGGQFDLPNLLPGRYPVSVRAIGFETLSTDLEVTPGNLTRVDLKLTANPSPVGSGGNASPPTPLLGGAPATLLLGIALVGAAAIVAAVGIAARRRGGHR